MCEAISVQILGLMPFQYLSFEKIAKLNQTTKFKTCQKLMYLQVTYQMTQMKKAY